MNLTDLVRSFDGLTFTTSDDEERRLRLLPGLSATEIDQLAAKLPCPLPAEIRELLAFSAGIVESEADPATGKERIDEENTMGSPDDAVHLERLRFGGNDEGPYGPITFPCVHWPVLAVDGCGNFWAVDLTPDSREWGPIYYVCHDPAAIVYQARDLAEFLEQVRALLTDRTNASPLARVHEDEVFAAYESRSPRPFTHAEALMGDESLRAFAEKLGPEYRFVDLRRARIGEGVTLRHITLRDDGALRHGHERIFAFRPPGPSWWRRLFGKRPPSA